jgi:hypothetical protein
MKSITGSVALDRYAVAAGAKAKRVPPLITVHIRAPDASHTVVKRVSAIGGVLVVWHANNESAVFQLPAAAEHSNFSFSAVLGTAQ